MDLDRILPNVLVGSCPTSRGDVVHLKAGFGVTAVLNVQTDEDMAFWGIEWADFEGAYREAGIECRRVPVPDFDPGELRRRLSDCVQALDALLRAGHTVYVHCSAGINRSPSTVVAYLHWLQGMTLAEAMALVTRRRHCDPYLEAIRQASEDRAAEKDGDSG